MLVVLVNNGFVAAGGLEYYSVCLSAFDVVPGLAADYWSIMLCKPPLDDVSFLRLFLFQRAFL